jgi:3,4-dihydroxy 2-butanone 4-phosphate synthase/GTP cyclohydrolase II
MGNKGLLLQRNHKSMSAIRLAESRLPTTFGEFTMITYESGKRDMPHIVLHNLTEKRDVTDIRIHSECMTGDVFGSLRCDCGEQLHHSMEHIAKHGGVLIYLRQEGRGIGLVNKLKAYNLQDEGMDTVMANVVLGFHPDERSYDEAVAILNDLGISSVRVLTNNPEKLDALIQAGIEVAGRLGIEVKAGSENAGYLHTKKVSFGHLLGLDPKSE